MARARSRVDQCAMPVEGVKAEGWRLGSQHCSSKPTIGAIKSGDRFAGGYNKVWSPAPFLTLKTRHVTSNTRRFRGQNVQEFYSHK